MRSAPGRRGTVCEQPQNQRPVSSSVPQPPLLPQRSGHEDQEQARSTTHTSTTSALLSLGTEHGSSHQLLTLRQRLPRRRSRITLQPASSHEIRFAPAPPISILALRQDRNLGGSKPSEPGGRGGWRWASPKKCFPTGLGSMAHPGSMAHLAHWLTASRAPPRSPRRTGPHALAPPCDGPRRLRRRTRTRPRIFRAGGARSR
jgi:hypothetical protein